MRDGWKAAVCWLALVPAGAACAQSYPERPIRLIVPYPPGGGTDAFARILGPKLTEAFGQQIVVDNRGGAQGSIGTAMGAKAPPDGYTLLLAHQGAITINPHIYGDKTGFDALRDIAAVARGTATAAVVVAHPSVQASNLRELADLAKRYPGKLTFASTGTVLQVLGELFKITTGTNLVHVPYKGAGPAVIDLLGGNVNVMFSNPTSTVPHVKSGKLRALGVLGAKRNDALPGAQTALEAGYPELADVLEWYGIAAPAGTPKAVIAKLNAAILRALDSPDLLKRMGGLGQTVAGSSVEEFAQQIRTDYVRWGKVVKTAGIKVD